MHAVDAFKNGCHLQNGCHGRSGGFTKGPFTKIKLVTGMLSIIPLGSFKHLGSLGLFLAWLTSIFWSSLHGSPIICSVIVLKLDPPPGFTIKGLGLGLKQTKLKLKGVKTKLKLKRVIPTPKEDKSSLNLLGLPDRLLLNTSALLFRVEGNQSKWVLGDILQHFLKKSYSPTMTLCCPSGDVSLKYDTQVTERRDATEYASH